MTPTLVHPPQITSRAPPTDPPRPCPGHDNTLTPHCDTSRRRRNNRAVAYTGAVLLFARCFLVCDPSIARNGLLTWMFSFAFAAALLKNTADAWGSFATTSAPIELAQVSALGLFFPAPVGTFNSTASLIGAVGSTLSFAALAWLTAVTAAGRNTKDSAVVAGFAAWQAGQCTFCWLGYCSQPEEDGVKAAFVITGLCCYAAWLAHAYAAFQLRVSGPDVWRSVMTCGKPDGEGMGPSLFFAAFSLRWFAAGTAMFAFYDAEFGEAGAGTTKAFFKAGQCVAALALTAGCVAMGLCGHFFSETKSKKVFVVALTCWMVADATTQWMTFADCVSENANAQDVNNLYAVVWAASSYIAAFVSCIFVAANTWYVKDEGGIVFFGSGGTGTTDGGGDNDDHHHRNNDDSDDDDVMLIPQVDMPQPRHFPQAVRTGASQPKARFCKSCGAPNAGGKFCQSCGTPQ